MSILDTIRSLDTAMAADLNARDGSAAAARYTDGGAVLPPGAPFLEGSGAIAAAWQGAVDQGLTDIEIEPVEAEEFGEDAIARGVVRGRLGDIVLRGKYMVWWKKDGGDWKMHRDIWNFDE